MGKATTNPPNSATLLSPVTTPTTAGGTTIGGSATGINIPAKANGNNGTGIIISPRYKEFKTYSSTFDALQALEQSQQSNGMHSVVVATNGANSATNNGIVSNGHLSDDTPPPNQILNRNVTSGNSGRGW